MEVPYSSCMSNDSILKLPNPINISRSRLNSLSRDWFVTTKVDGVRYLWVECVFAGQRFKVCIDRSRQFEILASIDCGEEKNGIIFALDTEFVNGAFVCHDVFVWDEVPVLFRDFSRRMKFMYNLREMDGMPCCKSFFPVSQIKMVPGAEPSDGYIFVHATNKFETGKSTTVLKWKPENLISIDLYFDREGKAWCSCKGGKQEFSHEIGEPCLPMSEIADKVVECFLVEGRWCPQKIRTDKSTPNDAHVVNETIKSREKPVTLSALHSKCESLL